MSDLKLPLGSYELLSSKLTETIIIVIITIIVLFWFRPKRDTVRKEKHNGKLVEIISDESSCNKTIDKLLKNNVFLLGLDCEWTPSIPQFNGKNYKIGLLQLSTDSNIILIRLNQMNYKIPTSLQLLS